MQELRQRRPALCTRIGLDNERPRELIKPLLERQLLAADRDPADQDLAPAEWPSRLLLELEPLLAEIKHEPAHPPHTRESTAAALHPQPLRQGAREPLRKRFHECAQIGRISAQRGRNKIKARRVHRQSLRRQPPPTQPTAGGIMLNQWAAPLTVADLRARAGLRLGGGRWLVPPWTAPALLGCAVVLIPWTALLFVTLPRHYVANHWELAWGGFDIALGLALGSTAVMVARRSPLAEVTATITGSLLCCDAWFDVLTSRGTSDIAQAAASALFIELPLAALCFWMARNLAHAVEVARPFLQAAGFTIADNKLVPPPNPAESGNE